MNTSLVSEHRRGAVLALTAVVCLLPIPVQAQLSVDVIATGLTQPIAFVQDPAQTNVFYVVEQGGLVKAFVDGQVEPQPFADLRAFITTGGERGLLGMAFSPDTASGRVFFNYTDVNGDTVVARYTRSSTSPLVIDPSSRLDLQWSTGERVIQQPFANHNGGNLVFGPDGYLYIGLGDGGSSNDPQNNAQNPDSLPGKMLRIDVGVPDWNANGFVVPSSNPFLDGQPLLALPEIWSFGLRNPWRYSFDDFGPGATNALLIGDVGQGQREEIDHEPPGGGGRNYGWRMREGFIATPGVPATTPAFEPLIDPIFDYPRTEGRSVTGGYVYRGSALPAAYRGRYFFADFITGRVWSFTLAPTPGPLGSGGPSRGCEPQVPGPPCVLPPTWPDLIDHTSDLGGSLGNISSFGRDANGELYLVTYPGRILKIVPEGASMPPPLLPVPIR